MLLCFSLQIFSQNNPIKVENLNNKYFLTFYFHEEKFTYNYVPDSLPSEKAIYSNISLPEKELDSSVFIFRSFFEIDKSIRNESFSLSIGPVNYPCKIFLNGSLICNLGQLSKKSTTKIQFASAIFFPPELLKKDSINEISIQAYSKSEDKTSLGNFFISSSKKVETYTFIRNLLRENVVQASMVFSFILSIYFLFGFFLKKDKNDKKYIYFALFCLGFSVGYSNLGLSFNFIDDVILYKVTRMGIPFAALMLLYYTLEFTNIIKNRKILSILLTLPIIFFEIIYAVQTNLAGIEKTFSSYTMFVNLPYMLFAFVLSIISAIKTKRKSHISFFIGFVILFIGIFHDTYFFLHNVIAYTWLVPHGFLLMIITTFFILAVEQTKIYHISIQRGEALQKMKDNLEDLVIQRTEKINQQNEELQMQAENLRTVNSLLQETHAEVLQQKEELLTQTENLRNANVEITSQRDLIKKSHTEITASINYAKRIQRGLLPADEIFKSVFSDFFVVYKPKDIVSGDFYFFRQINEIVVIVTADCTGHGVPGAFMSLLGIAFIAESR